MKYHQIKFLSILGILLFITSIGFNISQHKEYEELRVKLNICKSEKQGLEANILELQRDLDECVSQKNHYQSQYS